MLVRFALTLVLLIVALSAPALSGTVRVHDNQLIVKMAAGRQASALETRGAKSVSRVRSLRLSYDTYEIVRVPEGEDPFEYARQLEDSGLVEFAYPNVIKTVTSLEELEAGPSFTPDDTYLLNPYSSFAQAWENPRACQWGLLWTNAPLAWHYTTGTSNVVVAMIDTGIKFEHPEIQGRLWVNADEIPGNAIDDDGNGWVDDIYGYDFSTYNVEQQTGGDPDPADTQPDASAHGTATAGIIGAASNNGMGIAGVAGGGRGSDTGVRLMILRVGTNANITVDAEIAALDYAAQNGARIINMSFGGPTGGPPEANAITRAWNAGALIIAAAGNYPAGNPDGIDLPAGFDEVIAVGATTIFSSRTVYPTTLLIPETVADYSKVGPELELVAPGTHIITLLGSSGYTTDSDIQFKGTSASTPIVSGFAALLASYLPSHTNQQLRSMMHNSVVDLGRRGFDEDYGYGRIDMVKAFRDYEPPEVELVGDANGDDVVDKNDVAVLADPRHYGKQNGTPGYMPRADTNKDDIIDELDIFLIGLNYGKTRDDL